MTSSSSRRAECQGADCSNFEVLRKAAQDWSAYFFRSFFSFIYSYEHVFDSKVCSDGWSSVVLHRVRSCIFQASPRRGTSAFRFLRQEPLCVFRVGAHMFDPERSKTGS